MAATINLRTFPDPKDIECPNCHAHLTLYDPEGSEYVVCSSCNSYCHINKQGKTYVQQPLSPLQYTPGIPIGKEGTLKDTRYKTIGYMEKKESGTQYEWREYMLYSYVKGYAFLAEYDGHWSFIAGKQHFPEELKTASATGTVGYLGEAEYQEFNHYMPVIIAFAGEYDWDVYEERVETTEFINPPWMLVREVNKASSRIVDWYLGEYIEPEEVATAFNVPIDNFPERVDIGANQPNPTRQRFWQTLRISAVALALMVLIQIVFGFLRPGHQQVSNNIAISPTPVKDTLKQDSLKRDSLKHDSIMLSLSSSSASPYLDNGNYEYQPARTKSFTIENGPAPVEISLNAGVDNNWFEGTFELVNEKDNQTWDVTKEVEYYHGYEDGENWSEGQTDASVDIDNVPAGRYHLNIYPYAGTGMLSSVSVKVNDNIILWQNILITALILCLAPLAFWYLQRRFEVNRWMNSDYSPYAKSSEE